MIKVNKDLCINCSSCETVCPTSSITINDKADDKGRQLLQEIENYFANGEPMSDPSLQDKVEAWYEGRLCGGYYMTQNNDELMHEEHRGF